MANIKRIPTDMIEDRVTGKKLETLISDISKTPNDYEWTAIAGQLVYVLPSGQTYDPTGKWMEVWVGGIPVSSSSLQKDSSSQFTLLIDSTTIQAGMKVYARWINPYTPATASHHVNHELNGSDEIDITKLRNYQEQVVTPLAEITNNTIYVSDITATNIQTA